ncbi:MAG: DUF3048 domain-containing protein [Bacillus sp. (in: firmicutes)]
MKLKTISCILAASILFAGCSKEKEPTVDKPVNNQSETTGEVNYMYPLTGETAEDAARKRPVAVMINNHPKARPQSGLHQADIVYELLAEGDVTRFLAIYQSEQPEVVGPVRSARDYYIELAKGLDSIYICHGYSPEAKEMLDDGYIDNLNGLFYDGTLFIRDKSRKAPHNSYITFANIETGIEEKSFDTEKQPKGFAFLTEEEAESLSGEAASSATVKYGSSAFDVTYNYDEAIKQYTRLTNGEQTVDRETGEPVLLNNIVVLSAPHHVTDSQGRRDIDFSGGGEAYLLQQGVWNKIQWKYEDQRIILMKEGKEAKLVPGKTWVNVIPDQPGIEANVSFQ